MARKKEVLNISHSWISAEVFGKFGVFDPNDAEKEEQRELLKFDTIPDRKILIEKSKNIAKHAKELCDKYKVETVHIGNMPSFLVRDLEEALHIERLNVIFTIPKSCLSDKGQDELRSKERDKSSFQHYAGIMRGRNKYTSHILRDKKETTGSLNTPYGTTFDKGLAKSRQKRGETHNV